MKKYNKNPVFILLAVCITSMICMAVDCNKGPVGVTYLLLDTLALPNVQSTYHIGDTVWVSYQSNNNGLIDRDSHQRIMTGQVYKHLFLGFNAYTNAPDSISNAATVILNGIDQPSYDPKYGLLSFGFGCVDSVQGFKVGWALKKVGIYGISILDGGIITGDCTNNNTFPYSGWLLHFPTANAGVYNQLPTTARNDTLNAEVQNQSIYFLNVE